MAATAKSAPAEVKKSESTEAASATASQIELNMEVSDTEDDDEFLGDDLSSFDEGVAPPEKDRPDLIILNRKLQELEEAKKWKQANPNDTNCIVKRPEQDPLHPNVYFDKYMGMKKLKAVEQKLKFTRGVLRRFAGKDINALKLGNRVKLQRAEKILASVVASHTGKEYVAPKHDAIAPSYTVEDMKTMNFRAKNRIIMAAKKFIPRIEAKKESERTPWEVANYPFYKEVIAAFPETIKASPEEVQAYNKKKNAHKAERKQRHKEDQLDKALNFIDYLLKYKEQPFTPMTKAKLERSFEVILKQFKFQTPPKLEASKTQPVVIAKDDKKPAQQNKNQQQQKGGHNQQKQQRQGGVNQPQDQVNRKRPGNNMQQNNVRAPKVPRNNVNQGVNSGGNFQRRNNPTGNFGSGTINRVADIWSSVGAALNQLSSQSSNFNNNKQGNFGGNNGPDNFRQGGGGGRDNFNNNISDMLFNRGGGNNSGFNDGGRRFNNDNNDNFGGGRNFNDQRMMSSNFNRGGGNNGNFNNSQGGNFRGNNPGNFGGNSGGFGGNNSGNFPGNSGGGNNFNNSGFNSGGYGGLDLNRANRGAPMDDLFTRNRSRL